MKTPRVQGVCLRIWELREDSYLRRRGALAERDLPRELGLAVGEDLREFPSYDWTQDTRVEWAMEVLRAAGQGRVPEASAQVEATAGMLLGKAEFFAGGCERGAGSAVRRERFSESRNTQPLFPPFNC